MSNLKQRETWPDAAKGACIALVVLLHATQVLYGNSASLDAPRLVSLFWDGISTVLTPVRMPLFFAISGYFSVRIIERPWRSLTAGRVLPLVYLYILWVGVIGLVDYFSGEQSGVRTMLGFVIPYTKIWYLYALVLYVVVAKSLKRWRMQVLLAAALLSVVAYATTTLEISNVFRVMQNAIYFLGAAYLPQWIDGAAKRASLRTAAAAGFAFLVCSIALAAASFVTENGATVIGFGLGLVKLGTGALGVFAGVLVFVTLSGTVFRVLQPLVRLGQTTLPVYVMHFLFMGLVGAVTAGWILPLVVLWLMPIAVTIVVISLSLLVHRIAIRVGARWLFEIPAAIPRSVLKPALTGK